MLIIICLAFVSNVNYLSEKVNILLMAILLDGENRTTENGNFQLTHTKLLQCSLIYFNRIRL